MKFIQYSGSWEGSEPIFDMCEEKNTIFNPDENDEVRRFWDDPQNIINLIDLIFLNDDRQQYLS